MWNALLAPTTCPHNNMFYFRGKVGMGRGHKKSKVYEDFVMTRRTQLKNQYNLCEVAIKKILCYSNNFLFKKLKSQEVRSGISIAILLPFVSLVTLNMMRITH